MKRDIPLKGGDEYDGLTRWRRYLYWRPGERKRIKEGFNRRERHVAKERLKEERDGSQ